MATRAHRMSGRGSGIRKRKTAARASSRKVAPDLARLRRELEDCKRELREALEQQTATAEILKVISSSPTDVQPVFDVIGRLAEKLCRTDISVVSTFDGERIQLRALHGMVKSGVALVRRAFPMNPDDETITARAFRTRKVVQVADVLADRSYGQKNAARAGGYRGCLGVPMVRDGKVVGVIFVARSTPGRFADPQVELLKTFADQAVIAIENVRLFNETKEALERQTATAEILRVISSSPTDTQPVFDAILEKAIRLCEAHMGHLSLYDGEKIHTVAQRGVSAEYANFHSERGPFRPPPGSGLLRMITERQAIHVADRRDTPEYRAGLPTVVAIVEMGGARTFIAVPMLKEGRVIGGISIYRPEVRPFTQKQIDLVSTFANQAVIAIENVRLFNEIQEKSRQLEIASRHKSDFLAHMSHELRTPLNAIIGFSEALTARMFGEVNAKQDEYLRDIHSSGQHLLSLINDILDLAKVEAGRMELELSEFNLSSALQNAMTLVRERAQTHGIALELRADEKLGPIRADERKVKQIVLNLLSNAVKFTPDGGRVEVDAHVNDALAEISVKDTGAGIAPEDQATLFEEFRQVGRNTAGKREGTGLGLALTRRFVELHGGKISLQSAPGKGSTFTFTIPLNRN